ncbi:nucleotidyl transferase AbiEii/AbiGii toxin family protein [uncultured Microscilla sp.]|uniref:nucleotidyl transferase AbiEii/AbiGii toxin family protein n=1 Tax=uncultured Microscilla sp. TaxID=432653 RepID=UPI002624FEDC|nr:nucleotidyl transferase AbiEii/AbiGii toxin family protein [uncultured Microscilla sp.]
MTYSIPSIKAKLKRIAQEKGVPFMTILFRYFHERILYRLSVSDYKDNFCLKGGSLLYAMKQEASRPTKDIDFLGQQISNDTDNLIKTFKEIFQIDYQEDGVTFDLDSITTEQITENSAYAGTKIKIDVCLGKIRNKMQIDIGFGDVITPTSEEIKFPTFLDNMDVPLIKAYNAQSIIAEKFQAMIDLGTSNGRVKDFYDVYNLLLREEYDDLEPAILKTLSVRNTPYTQNHVLFTQEFAQNSTPSALGIKLLTYSLATFAP